MATGADGDTKTAASRINISNYGGSEEKTENRDTFLREIMELIEALAPLYHAALLQEIGLDDKTLMDFTKMPIGFRIRRGLKLANLQAVRIKEPEPPNFAPLLRAQEKYLRSWRRRRGLAAMRGPGSQPKPES